MSDMLHLLLPQSERFIEDITVLGKERYALFNQIYSQVLELQRIYGEDSYRQVRTILQQESSLHTELNKLRAMQDAMWRIALSGLLEEQERIHELVLSNCNGPSKAIIPTGKPDISYYRSQNPIHRMPGGYIQDTSSYFWLNGALYDLGTSIYFMGTIDNFNDLCGSILVRKILPFARKHFGLSTDANEMIHMLDMGCTVGHATLAFANQLNATVTAIDIGCDLLRYAAARANFLKSAPVTFLLDDARNTSLDAEQYDLIVSTIILHELPRSARKAIFRESYRLLKPGGLMLHLDSKNFLNPQNAVMRYINECEARNNNEFFINACSYDDMISMLQTAGFNSQHTATIYAGENVETSLSPDGRWVAFSAVKV